MLQCVYHQVLVTALASEDALFHYTLYSWFILRGEQKLLVAHRTLFLEDFLQRVVCVCKNNSPAAACVNGPPGLAVAPAGALAAAAPAVQPGGFIGSRCPRGASCWSGKELLWQYYMTHNRFSEAASVMEALAQR